jgi:hypothetical protein
MITDINANTFIMTGYQALVTTGEKPAAKPTALRERAMYGNEDIIRWGTDNNFPKRIREQAYKIPAIPPSILFHVNMTAGAPISPVVPTVDQDNKRSHRAIIDPEIEAFIGDIKFRKFMMESASDLYWFQNVFPEMVLTKNRKKISYLSPNEAMYSRWSAQNADGQCEYLHMNANWPNARVSDPYTKTVKAIDPYQADIVEAVRADSQHYKFIFPSSYPSPGALFYQLAFWDGIRQSKYLDVLETIPAAKAYIIKNKLKVRKHIHIPQSHWERWYGQEWHQADPAKRKLLKQDYLKNLEDMLTRDDGAVAFATEFGSSTIDGKTAEKWEITDINDSTDKNTIEDMGEATSQLFYAIGIDPTLAGFASKEMGSRSGGSDKREAFLIYLEKMKPLRDVLLEPLRFVAQFNGWTKKYPGLDFHFEHKLLTTLDTGSSTQTTQAA